ncbi:hypothetical protein FRC02_006147 [Tulasnella sp. 418]|nr:hypothetical protein FRC02_006147 [Tulasnella sp. 418]
MRAVLIKDGKGPIENLYIGDAETPKPTNAGEILVKVKTFGLNRMDILQREGMYPVPAGASTILGVEFSGVVAELGPETSQFKVGDEVLGLAYGGAYAEYIVAYENMLAPKPDHLTWAEAAGIPENWLTSYQALFMVGEVKKGEKVLLHVGASGIGVSANQMAKFFGMEQVITTAGSPEKLSFLKSMPYHPTDTINYKTEDFLGEYGSLREAKELTLSLMRSARLVSSCFVNFH